MWARIMEVMLGVWLAITPFVFRYPGEDTFAWVMDFVAAALVCTFALFSYWPRTHRAHLGNVLVAGGLCVHAYFIVGHPAPPPAQNHFFVGLLLLMSAILPSHNEQPPSAWRAFYRARRDLTTG